MSKSTAVSSGADAAPRPYFEACKVLGITPPDSKEQCEAFAQRAVAAAKTKASLFAKVLPTPIKHTEILDIIAQSLGFKDKWYGLTHYAKMFPNLSVAERASDFRSTHLCLACFVLTDELVEKNPFASTIIQILWNAYTQYFKDVVRGELALRAMFFKKENFLKEAGLDTKQISTTFKNWLSWEPHHYVTTMLARVPSDASQRQYPPLSKLSVADLMAMRLANKGFDEGFGCQGWEHAVASMQAPLQLWANMKDTLDAYPDEDAVTDVLTTKAKALVTRLRCRDVVERHLRPVMNKSVLEVITRSKGRNGFFLDIYSGAPEQVQRKLQDFLFEGVGSAKRIVFREPFGEGLSLTIFRTRYLMDEEERAACYKAQAMLHNKADELVARVGLVLVSAPEDYSLEELAVMLDETSDNEVQEMSDTVVDAAVAGETFISGEWRRLLFVRHWEVRAKDRGAGLGVKLLKASIKKAFKGLPSPTAVVAQLWPLQLHRTCMQASPGIPEIDGPKEHLQGYWRRDVLDKGVLPKTVKVNLEAGYYPARHMADPGLDILAFGHIRRRAKDYEKLLSTDHLL